jgi:hypothetical protein
MITEFILVYFSVTLVKKRSNTTQILAILSAKIN